MRVVYWDYSSFIVSGYGFAGWSWQETMIVLGLFTFLQGFSVSFNWTTASGWGGRTGGQSSFADAVLDAVLDVVLDVVLDTVLSSWKSATRDHKN